MSEEWREIPGWEGFYAVSTLGRVKGLPRTIQHRGRLIRIPERIMKQHVNAGGYLNVWLSRDGRGRRVMVHRIALLAFVGPPPEGTEGCHNDGVCTNNKLSNLRWDTRSANQRDLVAHGNHAHARKTHCVRGHAFTDANTYRPPSGQRTCRKCKAARRRTYQLRKKEAA